MNSSDKNKKENISDNINLSQGEKFVIHQHLKKLRASQQEKTLSKIIKYIEEKGQNKTCNFGQCI